jgi:hypothetical protein
MKRSVTRMPVLQVGGKGINQPTNQPTIEGYGLVTQFIDHLQVVTTNNYNTIADFLTLQITTR